MITLPNLTYQYKDLAPYISEATVTLHHSKHHQAYVTNANNLIKDTAYDNLSLNQLVVEANKPNAPKGLFNNAGQAWNHVIYWECMRPNPSQKKQEPFGQIATQIQKDFGTMDNFIKQFKEAALTQFGSGWAWLAVNNNQLQILKTDNANNPLALGYTKTLFGIDVWEHAYYLDYQNKRADYIDNFIQYLINWDYVEQQFTRS